ncbi:hypothetical protein NDU88_004420 [Pleurodeles waltl]|uniref:Uncharacterized protein n=1 Tax=Pleurodeles waltl TaxID=8319 RepID=A0AAV7UH21_PLEWA|nr:hypothetical protein NDU88_004420 [Pleurodeles waltl]
MRCATIVRPTTSPTRGAVRKARGPQRDRPTPKGIPLRSSPTEVRNREDPQGTRGSACRELTTQSEEASLSEPIWRGVTLQEEKRGPRHE